jgi:uncharacterized membrane protein
VLLQATETFWLWQFLGRLHPLLVHFPIGLLLVALLFELIDWKRKSTGLRDATKILTWVGAGSAVFAVTFGLLLASAEDASGDQPGNTPLGRYCDHDIGNPCDIVFAFQ